MEADKEMLNRLLNEIQELVRENENEDGTYRFDLLKAVIALDFAKTEIEKDKIEEKSRADAVPAFPAPQGRFSSGT